MTVNNIKAGNLAGSQHHSSHTTFTNKMTLTPAQLNQFVENYVSQIIDGMDIKTMERILFDVLTSDYETYTEEQILGEIKDLYNEEYAQELLESVADVQIA